MIFSCSNELNDNTSINSKNNQSSTTSLPTATPVKTTIPTAIPTKVPIPTATPVKTTIPTVIPTKVPIPTGTPVKTTIPTVIPTKVPILTATPDIPIISEKAMTYIYDVHNIKPSDIKLFKYEKKQWPSYAMGCPEPGKFYAQAELLGWVLHFIDTNNKEYFIHIDETGTIIIECKNKISEKLNIEPTSTKTPVPTATSIPTSTPTSVPTPIPTSVPKPTLVKISISNFQFEKKILDIMVGSTVSWMNNDSYSHTITSSNGIFSSGFLSFQQKYEFTFNSTGTYKYKCDLHSNMSGIINVSSVDN